MTPEQLDQGNRAYWRDVTDSRRALADAARYARENRAAINAEWDALPDVPRTIAAHLAGFKGDAA